MLEHELVEMATRGLGILFHQDEIGYPIYKGYDPTSGQSSTSQTFKGRKGQRIRNKKKERVVYVDIDVNDQGQTLNLIMSKRVRLTLLNFEP